MTRRRKNSARKKPRRKGGGPVLPPGWQSTGRELKDPGAGFMEVFMVDLQTPDLAGVSGVMSQMLLFHEVAAGEPCPCGSGRTFGQCHHNAQRVPILCRNLGADTYSDVLAHEVTFPVEDAIAVRRMLMALPELRLTQDISGRTFWQFLGHPLHTTELGNLIFATVELNPDRLYFVTLSRQRSLEIMAILKALVGAYLGQPLIQEWEIESQYRSMINQ